MKRIVFLVCFLAFVSARAADSTNVTIQWQARDIEYSAPIIYGNEFYENLTDTLRVRYRAANNPTATQTIAITGYSKDFLEVLKALKSDITAKANNVDSRLKSLLNALGDTFISEKISVMDAGEQTQFITQRQYGKFRLTRKKE